MAAHELHSRVSLSCEKGLHPLINLQSVPPASSHRQKRVEPDRTDRNLQIRGFAAGTSFLSVAAFAHLCFSYATTTPKPSSKNTREGYDEHRLHQKPENSPLRTVFIIKVPPYTSTD